jgi:hypothetical protein
MLRRAAAFDKLPPQQQAALRAQVSRLSKTTTDPQIAEVLTQIRATIGEAERKDTGGMTVEDLLDEHRAGYAHYDPRRRAAFKSRMTRLAKAAEEDGDADAVATLTALADEIRASEESEAREEIRKLAEALRSAN